MLGTDTIRDVIAFPKTLGGIDPLSRSPAPVSLDVLDYYHIDKKVNLNDKEES